jgi:hypothetical protein
MGFSQLRFVAMGVAWNPGWAAVDTISLKREEGCRTLPPSAEPTTHAPTASPTVPPNEDLGCTFQQGFCGFVVRGDKGFVFQRRNGSDVPSIGADHREEESGIFLYAQSDASEDSSEVVTCCTQHTLLPTGLH